MPSPNPSPSPSTGLNLLTSVTAVSGRDAWAAGTVEHGSNGLRPLIMHWNGIRWSTVPSPRRTSISQLGSISAASAQDIWAVGSYGLTANHALIEHWNGTAWRVVAAPARPRGEVQLATVTTLSARSAWAAGSVCPDHCERNNPPSRTVIWHWNGRRWAPASSPSPGAASVLTGLAASSATNAWAVGEYCTKACPSPEATNRGQILILRWNGARWSRVAGPSLGPDEHSLFGVSTLSRRSTWAVGETCIPACNDRPVTQPLMVHWNGGGGGRAGADLPRERRVRRGTPPAAQELGGPLAGSGQRAARMAQRLADAVGDRRPGRRQYLLGCVVRAER